MLNSGPISKELLTLLKSLREKNVVLEQSKVEGNNEGDEKVVQDSGEGISSYISIFTDDTKVSREIGVLQKELQKDLDKIGG